jgi:Tfp pilus assembly protein PilF
MSINRNLARNLVRNFPRNVLCQQPHLLARGAVLLVVAGLSLATLLGGCSHKPSEGSLEAGNQAKQHRQFAEAETEYHNAINEAPDDARPHVALGQLYVTEKKPDLARSEFMKALEVAPNDPASHRALGDAYAEGGQPGLAEEQYRAAVALDPSNANYRMILGSALARAQKPGAAEAELRTAIGLNPKNAQAHLALANLLGGEAGRQEEAQAEMAEVRALDASLAPPQAAPPTAASNITPATASTPGATTRLRPLNKKFLLTHDSPVYSSANNASAVVGQVHHRKVVHVTGIMGDWFRVQLKNGTVGYIPVIAAE